MAELDVQPKKTPLWLWLLLLFIVLSLLFLFTKGCNRQSVTLNNSDSLLTDSAAAAVAITQPDWDAVDFNSPATFYDEINDTTITVWGNEKYTIYSLGENILFDTGQSILRGAAAEKLKLISLSLNKRFSGAYIGVYGHADSRGDTANNKQLAEDRAVAVRLWLIENGSVASEKISVHATGESQPIATNNTVRGRQQNRSVEVVAFVNPE